MLYPLARTSCKAWVYVVFAAALMLAASCGQAPPDTGASETTEEVADGTTEEASTSGTDKVVASYAVAQEEIEEEGGEKSVGEYRIGYIVEPVEGWWQGEAENLTWREPAENETNHIEILPFDSETGLLIPYMDIRVTVLDESGDEVAEQDLDFYWSEFLHYANNFSLPQSGSYTLRAELQSPDFPRHGSEDGEGKVFTESVTVEFENVTIDTGK